MGTRWAGSRTVAKNHLGPPTVAVRQGITEAPPDGQGGPRWVARLSNGQTVVGRPSWLSSGPRIVLPWDATSIGSDWQRLMERCRQENVRLTGLSLFVPNVGPQLFTLPEHKAGYGYMERHVKSVNSPESPRSGCEALSVCYWDDQRQITKEVRVYASGWLEHHDRYGWLPCMIGTREADVESNGADTLTAGGTA